MKASDPHRSTGIWYTSTADMRTLQPMGIQFVSIKENYPMSRKRFTAMTRCRSQPFVPGDHKTLALLLQGKGSILRKSLVPPENCLLQFGPKASYRTEQTVEYYDWVVQDWTQVGCRECYLLDWFAPNFAEDVADIFRSRGHAMCKIPGHTTGIVQTNDTRTIFCWIQTPRNG
jgi:hypothetical protein